MTKGDLAKQLFEDGCNCAQAVFCSFCDEMNMDKELALKLASSFGGGMGRMREVCGAVSGMFMVAGALKGYSDLDDKDKKAEHYALIQKMGKLFKEKTGSLICRELLKDEADTGNVPTERTAHFYNKRPCSELCRIAGDIAEELLLG